MLWWLIMGDWSIVSDTNSKDKASIAPDSSKSDWSIVPESSIAVQESPKNPTQESLDSGAEKVRQFIGKAFMAGNALPSVIGEQLVSGTLTKPNQMESTIGTMIDGATQTASYGIPKAIAKRILESNKLSYPEATDKTSENIGKIIGLIAPTQTATTIAKSLPGLIGQTMAKDIMRGVSEGAFVGFTESPDNFMDIRQRIKQGAIGGAIGGVVVPVAQAVNKVAFKATQLAEEVRSSLFEAKKGFGQQFESQLNGLIESNPSKVVDASEAFTSLNNLAKENSRVISDLKLGAKRAGLDKDLIDGFIKDPSTASEMTLNQTRQLKKAVANIPSIKANYAKGKFASFSDHEIDLIDFADQIKKSQLDAFPELEQINKTYSDQLNKYNSIKGKFKVGQMLNNMANNFGDKEVRKVVNSILPKEAIQKIGGYHQATQLLKTMGWTAIATGGIGAAEVGGSAIKHLFGG